MAADPMPTVSSGPKYHIYHADAEVLSAQLEQPIKQPTEQYGRVVLEKTRRDSLITQTVGETNIEGLISFQRGHTRVVGAQVQHKTDILGDVHDGWGTLASAILEGYNVLDVITADRVVAQVSTEHSMTEGSVPSVNFIGSSFENLRIGGYPVELELDLCICGEKPKGDRPYLHDRGFLERIGEQTERLFRTKDVPKLLQEKCGAQVAFIDDLKRRAKDGSSGDLSLTPTGQGNGHSKLHFSLVKSIAPIPIPGVKVFGNQIYIPLFGTVALGEVEVGVDHADASAPHRVGDTSLSPPSPSHYFRVKMLKMHLGCAVKGGGNGAGAMANGHGDPGGTP